MAPTLRHATLLGLALVACARPERFDPPLSTQAAARLAELRLTPLLDGTAVSRPSHHVLLTLTQTPLGLSIRDAREVDSPLPRPRAPSPEAWRIAVQDGSGKLLYLAQLKPPAALRGEFALEDGGIEAAHIEPPAEHVLTIRVPVLRGADTLRLYARADTLPSSDPRTQGAPPDAMIELGQVAYPHFPEAP